MNLSIKKIGFYLIGVYSLFIIESCRDEIKTNRVVKKQTLHFDFQMEQRSNNSSKNN